MAIRCLTRRWVPGKPTGYGWSVCGLPAILEDDEGKPVCAGHYRQLDVPDDPEPLWKRALRTRHATSSPGATSGGKE